jgi:threonylcarbamoyladenosine tRNA methylthiotransferase MtaB
MEDQVPEEIKTKRSARLISLADEMSKEFRDHYIGRTEEVLFEEANEIDGKLMYTGYTREYVRVAAESETPLDNCIREGKITGRINKETYYIL